MTDNDDLEELFPENIRKVGFRVSLIFSITLISYYFAFIFGIAEHSPSVLGLSNLLLFSSACFLFFAIPWHKLGLSLKKFGPLEFERKLEGQSEEHIKDISILENKISKLEAIIKTGGKEIDNLDMPTSPQESEMRDLIINFLSDYSQWSFSPLRMETWGAKQPGYEGLANNPSLLRKLLRSLFVEGILETRVSKNGNTLYRVSS